MSYADKRYTAANREAQFERYLQEVATQLWAEKTTIHKLLQHPCLSGYYAELRVASSYSQLFDLLFKLNIITPDDFSVLSELLTELSRQELLQPFYEVKLGGKGLKSSAGSRQRSRSWANTLGTVTSTVSGGASVSKFQVLLYRISSSFSAEDLKTVLFLMKDLIPRNKLESITSGSELLEIVQQRNCIHETRPEFLYTLLHDIGRDDLRRQVDNYKYGQMSASRDLLTSPNSRSRETENTRWFQRAYQYRLTLKKLSDNLSKNDLEVMKHYCRDYIPLQLLDEIDHNLDLFIALEDTGRLNRTDVTILDELLDNKRHLLDSLYNRLENSQLPSRDSSQLPSRENSLTVRFKTKSSRNCRLLSRENSFCVQSKLGIENLSCMQKEQKALREYNAMVRKISSGLGKKEVKELKLMQRERNHATEAVVSGSQLLEHWERLGLTSPTNTCFLQQCLATIGRSDLLIPIAAYKLVREQYGSLTKEEQCPTQETGEHYLLQTSPTESQASSEVSTASVSTSSLERTQPSLPTDTATLQRTVSDLSKELELRDKMIGLYDEIRAKSAQIQELELANRTLEAQLQGAQSELREKATESQQLKDLNSSLLEENKRLKLENEDLNLRHFEEQVILHKAQKQLRISHHMNHGSKYGIIVTTPV